MEKLIEIKNITKSFDNKKVLDNISFSVNKGEIFGIIGQSGAGKTVLMKLLIGFYKPDSGEITCNGKNIFRNTKNFMQHVGFATQKHCFYYDLSVKENLKYFGKLYSMPSKAIRENTLRVLDLVELSDSKNKIAGKLSGGMQRRLDIACAILHNPDILVIDEPETGLDPVLREHIFEVIQKIHREGKTIILSSHFMKEVEPLCDRIAMLKQGILAAYGTPFELLSKFTNNYEIVLHTYPGNYNKILDALKKSKFPIIETKIEDKKLLIYVPQKKQPELYIKYVLASLGVLKETLLDIQLNPLSLEKVFKGLAVK